jgi:hypothetical protein
MQITEDSKEPHLNLIEARSSSNTLNSSVDEEQLHQIVDTGLVQNRITLAGFVLTLLVFTSTALLALLAATAQAKSASERTDYILTAPWVYINTVIPIFFGFLFAISSLILLLMSQELRRTSLFVLAEVFLYLAMSQALASCVGRIVVVIGLAAKSGEEFHTTVARSIEISVRVLPLAVWWALLFVAPAARIRRLPQKRSIILGYVSGLSLLMVCSALGYELKHEGPSGAVTFALSLLKQLIQPLFW